MHTTLEYMNFDVILFLMGTMVIMALLKQSCLFRWLIHKCLIITGFQPKRLVISILVIAAVMAAMVDEVTAMLFISTFIIELCKFFKISPIKFIMSAVFAINIGSSWTVLGNPIGIVIASKSGFVFNDFARWSLPAGVISLIAIILLSLFWQKDELLQMRAQLKTLLENRDDDLLCDQLQIKDKYLLRGSIVLFLTVVIALAFRHPLEIALGFEENSLMVTITLLGAAAAMLWQRQNARAYILDVDWWTLVFFIFLFAKAGSLEHVGLLDKAATLFNSVMSSASIPLLIVIIILSSGFVSATLDNVVVISVLSPLLYVMSNTSASTGSSILWWALLFGTCYGGNITMAGSHANIVAVGTMEEHTGYRMTLKEWLKYGLPGGVIPLLVGMVFLLIKN